MDGRVGPGHEDLGMEKDWHGEVPPEGSQAWVPGFRCAAPRMTSEEVLPPQAQGKTTTATVLIVGAIVLPRAYGGGGTRSVTVGA